MIFNKSNVGVELKTPTFLYPKSNHINYFEGKIPDFNKSIIQKIFYEKYNFNFKRNEIDKISELLKYKIKDFEINIGYDQLYLTKEEFSFEIYEIIDLSDFILMEDGYEKACIANAFKHFPNDFHYEKEALTDFIEMLKSEENDDCEDEYYDKVLKSMNELDVFLSIKKSDYERKKFLNPYTSELIQCLFYYGPKLRIFINEFENFGVHGHSPKYTHSYLDNWYFNNVDCVREDYLVRIKLDKNLNPIMPKHNPNELSSDFVREFSKIFNKWTEEQVSL